LAQNLSKIGPSFFAQSLSQLFSLYKLAQACASPEKFFV